jgi:N-acetylmuramoyl-L-alanine amidase
MKKLFPILVPFHVKNLVFSIMNSLLRRVRVRHPEQAKRVEGNARVLAQHDELIGKTHTYLIATVLVLVVGTGSLFAQRSDLTGLKFCIDPGHGGYFAATDRHVVPDAGTDFYESESNFQKALKLEALLKAQGAWVILTRYTNYYPNDEEPSLSARWQLANANGVDWFHSIHSNATGWTTNTTVNRTLMLLKEDIPTRKAEWPVALTMSDLMGAQIVAKNRTTSTETRLDYTFYGGYPNGFNLGVLKGLLMPGELSEGSFHDFFPETRRLMNIEYCKNEAYALLDAIMQYYVVPARTQCAIAGVQKDIATNTPMNYTRVRILPEDRVYNGDRFFNGFYYFDSLTAGTKTIRFETPGYNPDSVTLTLTAGSLTFVDRSFTSRAAPAINTASPAQNEPAFPINGAVYLCFTKPMDTASVRTAFSITPNIRGPFSWANNNSLLGFKPDSVFVSNQTYVVKIDTMARSATGQQFDGNGDGIPGEPYTLTFTTKYVDAFPPKIASAYPYINDSLVSVNNVLNFTFDEAINPATLTLTNIALQQVGSSLLGRSFVHYSARGRSGFNMFATNGLLPNKSYLVRIYNVTDMLGNPIPLAKAIMYYFSTSGYTFDSTPIDAFDGTIANWKSPNSDSYTTGVDTAQTQIALEATGIPSISPNTGAMRISFTWDTTKSNWLLRSELTGSTPKGITFTKTDRKVQAYVRGDASNVQFRFALEDSLNTFPNGSSTTKEVSKWITVDWIGWKLVEWDLERDVLGTWVGNGELNGWLRFDSFQLSYKPTSSASSGTIIIDQLQVGRKILASVPLDGSVTANNYTLEQNYPNPFNPETRIAFTVPVRSDVRISIYDILGREIRTLLQETIPAGSHSLTWNGKDQNGVQIPTGLYIYRLQSANVQLSRKMILMK